MVGIELIALGAPRFIGLDPVARDADPRAFIVALITLAAMIVPTIWGQREVAALPGAVWASRRLLVRVLASLLLPR